MIKKILLKLGFKCGQCEKSLFLEKKFRVEGSGNTYNPDGTFKKVDLKKLFPHRYCRECVFVFYKQVGAI